MRKKGLLLIILAFTSMNSILFAQVSGWQWVKSAGGSAYDIATSVKTDALGNCYVTGYFESPTLYFGTDSLKSAGGYDIFIAKYDINGNLLWVKSAGGKSLDQSNSIAVDASGNIYVAGYFQSDTINFDSITLINNGTYNLFLAKYDNNGKVIWAKSAGGSSKDYASAVAVDASGNVLLAGYYSSATVSFGNNILMNAGYLDIFLTKYDSTGNVLWAKSEGGTNDDYATSLTVDASGNTYLAGYFYSTTINFGSTILQNEAGNNVFVSKYDFQGNVLWAKSANETDMGQASSVAVDTAGNAYLAGYYSSSTVSFDNITLTNTDNGFNDIFLVKYDASGNALWAENAGGVDNDQVNSVVADVSGNAYITGDFNSPTITFGSTTLTNNGNYNIFLTKYNTNGNMIWAKSLGGKKSDEANSIALDASGNIFVTGDFLSDTLCIGSDTLVNKGATDIFIAKAGSNTGINEINKSIDISVFPNPTINHITVEVMNFQNTINNLFIYDVIGNLILEKTAHNNIASIDVSSFPRGLYMLEVISEKGIVVKKFVKE